MRKIRTLLAAFIVLLVLSGLTAFPLVTELNILAGVVTEADWVPDGLRQWILVVQGGLVDTDARYPFIAYGTDWLAFGHLVIALFFLGPLQDPIKNIWVINAGLMACAAVIPMAFVCGSIRQIPFYWRLIDCSFGVCGFLLLWYILKLIRRME